MDGQVIEAETGAVELVVAMADRTRHLYWHEPPGAESIELARYVYVTRLGRE